MAKNKFKNSFWGKKKNESDDFLNENSQNPQKDIIDNSNQNDLSSYENSDYSDIPNDYNDINETYFDPNDAAHYQNDYMNDNYSTLDTQNSDYDNNFLKDNQVFSEDDHEFDDTFSDDYLYDDNDVEYAPLTPAEHIEISDAEEIDSLLKNISDKLEKLETKEKPSTANTPFYAQNPMPYVFIPNQNSGNEVILNELAKLREENYRMQHSQEIQRQLTSLKDELNSKLAALDKETKTLNTKKEEQIQHQDTVKNDAVLLDELKKLNQKIEQLESKTSSNTSNQDLKQILEQISRLESRVNFGKIDNQKNGSYNDELIDLGNQIKYVSLKNDDVLAYIKSIRHSLGLSAIAHVNENGETDYSDLEKEYADFKSSIASGNLYSKISAISKFNELIAELPAGEHEEISSEFYRIRNKVFGTILTPEIAAELIFNTAAQDKEKDIYYYFELKGELDRTNTYDLASIADKFLKLRNRLQNNQYVVYNQNLYNELIEANSDFEYDQSSLSKERLKRAKETFSTLRIGDIIPINDYSKIRPSQNYKTISDKLNEIHKLISGNDKTALSEINTKLDTVIGDIKAVFSDNDESANLGQITQVLDEITSLKENLVLVGEERHQEVLNEITAIKNELTEKNAAEPDYDIKVQLYALQEEIREKYLNNDNAVLNSVNDIKEQLNALSDYSELDDIPSISNEALLDEIKSLKEQLYVQKGEFDPEILSEVRNLKELLAASRKEESYSDIITGLSNIEKRLDESNQAEKQDYETVLTSTLEVLSTQIDQLTEKTEKLGQFDNYELLDEIAVLKAQIEAISIPTVVHEGGEKVKLDYTELNEQLDKIYNLIEVLQSKGEDSDDNLAINVFRESMIEVLNEITALKDEYLYQSEKNDNLINEINVLKEQISQNTISREDSSFADEFIQIKELINNRLNDSEQNNQAYQAMLDELGQLKALIAQLQPSEQDNAQILKTLGDLKESFLISKADTDNSFIVETSSIREQLGALKKTLDFNKMSEDINELKTSVKDNKPVLDTENIRTIIREELKNTRASELTLGIASIEKQMIDIKKELHSRHEADTATLNFMVQIVSLLDKQQNSEENDNSSILNDVTKLKDEIDSLKTVKNEKISEESEKFAKRITSLKEELSQIAQIAAPDEESINNPMKEAVAELDLAIQNNNYDESLDNENTQKELLRKQLIEGGLPDNAVDEIINSIYPEK